MCPTGAAAGAGHFGKTTWNLPGLPSPLLPHVRALPRLLLLVMLLGPNTVAGSLGVPVMTIGVKR